MKIQSILMMPRLVPSALRKDDNGKPMSFVEPDGNHHVAFYKDENDVITETIVTKWQAVQRKLNHIPIIIDNPSQTWSEFLGRNDVPDELLKSLPKDSSTFLLSLQIGEAFIMGMEDADYQKAIEEKDTRSLTEHLYFVQSISSYDYRFRRHVEAQYDTNDINKEDLRFLRIRNIQALFEYNPYKIKVTVLGDVIHK